MENEYQNGESIAEKKKSSGIVQKWWFWVIVGLIVISVFGSSKNLQNDKNTASKTTTSTSQSDNTAEEKIASENTENETADKTQAGETEHYNSESVPKTNNASVPTEYKSALEKAKIYSNTMHMSKKGIYNQLVSEYGEKFSPEAAQYAIDNISADWKQNALKKAETYQNSMHMSPQAIRDQLVSEYGENFTLEEADYAVSNLK